VLISTHILPEVEMTCHRVLILQQGKILAADTPANLQKVMSDGGQVIAEIAAPLEDLRSCWENSTEIEFYDIAPVEGDFYRCSLTPSAGTDIREQIFALVSQQGWRLRELSRDRHSLEDIFVRVTRPEKEE
jgi:ABC-2 type transport system ATP-binding protein